MLCFTFCLIFCTVWGIHDPERILDRMHGSIQESLQFFTSYVNSQRIMEEHQNLLQLQRQLESISVKLEMISQNAIH